MGENCKMKQNLYLIRAEKLQKLNNLIVLQKL